MYAILDIETTGGHFSYEKITEIAIYIHDGKQITDSFSTLINPEKFIPPFITRLTGITNEMVEEAPRFFEVAKEIVKITEGKIIVGHNVQFDYGFIKEEFRSLGYSFNRDKLCTVRLSRKILPGHRSYSLGKLCTSIGIHHENHHRADGDALATVKLFELLLKEDRHGHIEQSKSSEFKSAKLPAQIDQSIIQKLPESAGVYYFHNIDGTVVYIGKSNNIRRRVLSHFTKTASAKALRMAQSTYDVTCEETGNELIALLYESQEIKTYQPIFNRSGKRKSLNYGIFKSESDDGYLKLTVDKVIETKEPIALANNLEEAKNLLARKVQQFSLCQKYCGHKVDYACFLHQVNLCHGACVGKEDSVTYNSRVLQAIQSFRPLQGTFAIFGKGRTFDERTVVLIENGNYSGWCYLDSSLRIENLESLKEIIGRVNFHKDYNWIIHQHLLQHGDRHVKKFDAAESTIFEK